jgi:hypothetical protein
VAIMADVFTKAKRSEVMSRIRSRGNKDTELALAKIFRAHRITGWRRQIQIITSPRPSPQNNVFPRQSSPGFATLSRSHGRGTRRGEGVGLSEFPEIELIAGDTEVVDDVSNDSTRYVARMPREGDKAVRTKRIRVMAMTARRAKKFTTDFAESPFQLTAVPRGVFAHGSGGENKFVAEGSRDGASGFEQRFQMDLGGLLKAERSFAPVASVRVAAGEQRRFGNPHAVFILTELHFREWNDHSSVTIARRASVVKRTFDA